MPHPLFFALLTYTCSEGLHPSTNPCPFLPLTFLLSLDRDASLRKPRLAPSRHSPHVTQGRAQDDGQRQVLIQRLDSLHRDRSLGQGTGFQGENSREGWCAGAAASGKVLKDPETLGFYNVDEGHPCVFCFVLATTLEV
jgi:hypothetical protein